MVGCPRIVRGRFVSSVILVGSMASGVGFAACDAPSGAADVEEPRDGGLDAARVPDGAVGEAGVRDDGGVEDAGGDGGEGPLPPLPDPRAVGGPLTSEDYGERPFLSPSSLDEVLTGTYSLGREFFVADWLVAPNAARPNLDGLGPLFHATSCLACHPVDRRAPTLLPDGAVAFGLLFRLGRESALGAYTAGDPVFGGQLQPAAIGAVPAEATLTWIVDGAPPSVSASSPRPRFSAATHESYGALASETRLGARASPQLVGMGLLELVPDEVLLAWEDPDDRDGDGISGRAARLAVDGQARLGRFGWKAVQPSLRGQTSAAFAFDIGITSQLHPDDDCTETQVACRAQPSGGTPEFDAAGIEAVDRFMTYLAVPAARYRSDDPSTRLGQALFTRVGCARCHRSTLVTGDSDVDPALARRTFHPYTDLLLHDMGDGLADPIGEGDAAPGEWRTPPLWGLGLVEAAPNARFLHDGRAVSLADAVGWHGGEGASAARAFAALSEAEREALLAFVRAL